LCAIALVAVHNCLAALVCLSLAAAPAQGSVIAVAIGGGRTRGRSGGGPSLLAAAWRSLDDEWRGRVTHALCELAGFESVAGEVEPGFVLQEGEMLAAEAALRVATVATREKLRGLARQVVTELACGGAGRRAV